MTKRKRRTCIVDNPFLGEPPSGKVSSTYHRINQYLIALDDECMIRTKTISNDCAIAVDQLTDILFDDVETDKLGQSVDCLSMVDAALLLLPWTIKYILGNHLRITLVFRALEASLYFLNREHIGNGSFSSIQCQRILTRSVLFKLVPVIARIACETSSSDEENAVQNDVTVAKTPCTDSNLRNQVMNSTTNVDRHAAASYQYLLQQYKPTLEIACTTILLPIVQSMGLTHLSHDPHEKEGNRSRVTRSTVPDLILNETITWIEHLHTSGNGNPKTTFLLLQSLPVMLAIVRCWRYFDDEDRENILLCNKKWFHARHHVDRNALMKLLRSGLFSSAHHMNGYRSIILQHDTSTKTIAPDADVGISSKTSFRTYHEGLFALLRSSLSFKDSSIERVPCTGSTGFLNDSDVDIIAYAVPILLDCFMHEAIEWKHRTQEGIQSRHHKHPGNAEDFVRFQFRMFDQITQPLRALIVQCLEREEQMNLLTTALGSLTACLDILATNDGYLPNYDDDKGSMFQVLEELALTLLEFPINDMHFMGMQQAGCVVVSLRILLKLDHRLLLERLSDVMRVCFKFSDSRLDSAVVTLLVAVLDTFRLLRQQSTLYQALLCSLGDIESGTGTLRVQRQQLKNLSVVKAMSSFIYACPSSQAVSIFGLMHTTACDLCASLKVVSNCKLQVFEHLTLQLVTNVRLTNGNVVEIGEICQSFLSGPITELFQTGQRTSDTLGRCLERAALMLCGLFLDLKDRCAFLRESSSSFITSSIPCPIALSMKATDSSCEAFNLDDVDEGSELKDAWIIIWCYRLQELHTNLTKQDILGNDNVVDTQSTLVEASNLATFAITAAFQQNHVSVHGESRWVVLARNMSSWLPYASEAHIFMFLNWLVALVAMNPNSSDVLPLSSGLHCRTSFDHIENEIECALHLLCDSAFMSYPDMKERIRLAAVSCCIHWISLLFDTNSDSRVLNLVGFRNLVNGTSPVFTKWQRSRSSNLNDVLCHEAPVVLSSSVSKLTIILTLQCALRLLKAINGIPNLDSSSGYTMDFIDATLRLECVCRSLLDSEMQPIGEAIDIVGTLRLSLAVAMEPAAQPVLSWVFGNLEQLINTLETTISSSVTIGHKLTKLREDETLTQRLESLIIGTRAFVRALTRYALTINSEEIRTKEGGFVQLINSIAFHIHGKNEFVLHLLLMLIRPLLIVLTPFAATCGSEAACLIRDTLWKNIIEGKTLAKTSPVTSGVVYQTIGDLLRFSKDLGTWPNENILNNAISSCLENASRLDMDSCIQARQRIRYFVACVAVTTSSREFADRIVENAVNHAGQEDPFLESSFCHLIVTNSVSSVDTTLSILVERSISNVTFSKSPVIRLLRLFLQHVDRSTHVDAIALHGFPILRSALSHLHSRVRDEIPTRAAIEACLVVEDLSRSHDLLPLRERDLARILSHVSAILGPGIARSDLGDVKRLSTELFLQCSRVFLALFQRYTRHLYSCVPSVISTLRIFLFRVLYDTNDVSEDASNRRCHSFCRLCELMIPHKEIYKKHLIGILLEIIHAIQEQKISSSKKETLTPAIYSLLDSLTTYETKQLNVLVDQKGKPIFQALYQAHQKHHTYKGQ